MNYYKLRSLKMKLINDTDLFIATTQLFSSTMHTVISNLTNLDKMHIYVSFNLL